MNIESIDNVLLKENPKLHMTYIGNIENISKLGLVPKNGERNGKLISKEDPEYRVFFSNGKTATLELANNLGKVLNDVISKKGKSPNGYNGQNISEEMSNFFNEKNNSNTDMTFGFIDICNHISNLFEEGIQEDLSQEDKDKILFQIYKSVMDKFVYLDLDIHSSENKEDKDADYWFNDTNFNAKGTKKVPMTDRNSHTKVGRGIETEKINLISDSNGKYLSAWQVIKSLARQYKKENPETDYLPVDEEYYIDEKGIEQHYMAYDYLSDFIEFEVEQTKDIYDEKNQFYEDNEKYYYHYAGIKDIESILKDGLQPKNGEISQMINDEKTVIFFSEEKEGVIATNAAFYMEFEKRKKGTAYEDYTLNDVMRDKKGGDIIYLKFQGDSIENEEYKNKNIDDWAFADGYTTKQIPPEMLKVCVLKNKKDGQLFSYKREDIIKYLMSKTPIDNFLNNNEEPSKTTKIQQYYIDNTKDKENLEKFYEIMQQQLLEFESDNYYIEDMDLDKFYEQYIQQEKSESILFSEKDIGKSTISRDTTRLDIAQARISRDRNEMEIENKVY